jgi:hypothetical protein
VVALLSQDWLGALVAATSGLPPAEGATALVQYVVSGAPSGNATFFVQYDEGRVADGGVGKAAGEPDLVFTLTYGDAARLATGELELSAAYMQGTVKAEGDMAALFRLLPATHRPAYRAAIAEVGGTTEV